MSIPWLLFVASSCTTAPPNAAAGDHDGDGATAAEDCDDSDPAVAPGALDEPGDGVDSNCDGVDGTALSLDAFVAYVEDVPAVTRRVGWTLAVADLDGDGLAEVAVGSSEQQVFTDAGGSKGALAVLSGPGLGLLGRWDGDDFDTNELGRGLSSGRLGGRPAFVAMAVKRQVSVSLSEGEFDLQDVVLDRSCPMVLGDVTGDSIDDALHYCADPTVGVMVGPVRGDDVHRNDYVLPTFDAPSTFAIADATGDGVADAVVAEENLDEEYGLEGRVQVFAGPVAHSEPPPWLDVHGEPGERLGSSLGVADLDADGVPEVLIGAYGFPGGLRQGRVVGLEPGASLDAPTFEVVGEPGVARDLGRSMVVGDFDGDGVPDLAVGAPGTRYADLWQPGVVHVFFGPVAGTLTVNDADLHIAGAHGGDAAGLALAAGDVTGNGVDDLVVGAPHAEAELNVSNADPVTVPYAGRVYLVPGPLR